jgi:hypothetical protein
MPTNKITTAEGWEGTVRDKATPVCAGRSAAAGTAWTMPSTPPQVDRRAAMPLPGKVISGLVDKTKTYMIGKQTVSSIRSSRTRRTIEMILTKSRQLQMTPLISKRSCLSAVLVKVYCFVRSQISCMLRIIGCNFLIFSYISFSLIFFLSLFYLSLIEMIISIIFIMLYLNPSPYSCLPLVGRGVTAFNLFLFIFIIIIYT